MGPAREGQAHALGRRAQPSGGRQLARHARGEECFFYHSNEGLEIVGVCEVAREAYPDPSDETGKFVLVDIKPKRAVARPVSLAAIKQDKRLAEFALVRQSRLSVVPVRDAEWRILEAMGAAA